MGQAGATRAVPAPSAGARRGSTTPTRSSRRAGRSLFRRRGSKRRRAPSRARRFGDAQRRARTCDRAARGDRGPSEPYVVIAGTLDTKGEELRYIRDLIRSEGLRTRLVDLSTSGRSAGGDVTPQQIALASARGSTGISAGDRGTAVAAMTEAFTAWLFPDRRAFLLGIISAGGSGNTALVAPAMRALPVGVPKVLVSTVASGNVRAYVGPADIMMMHSVTDVQGLNRISRRVLGNAAHALAGMDAPERHPAAGHRGQGGRSGSPCSA